LKLKNLIEEEEKLNEEHAYWGSTVQMTMIDGGTATNVIPGNCRAHFNIRVTETFQDMKALKQQIENLVETY